MTQRFIGRILPFRTHTHTHTHKHDGQASPVQNCQWFHPTSQLYDPVSTLERDWYRASKFVFGLASQRHHELTRPAIYNSFCVLVTQFARRNRLVNKSIGFSGGGRLLALRDILRRRAISAANGAQRKSRIGPARTGSD
jgi:hypothetical protein